MGAFSRPLSTGSRGQRPQSRATSRSVQLLLLLGLAPLSPPPFTMEEKDEGSGGGAVSAPARLRRRRGEEEEGGGGARDLEDDADMPRALAR
jgi:hypothetical protein